MRAGPDASIVGLGMEGLTRQQSPPARDLARAAVLKSIADAGLALSEVDGLIVCRTSAATDDILGIDLQKSVGLKSLRFLEVVQLEGASSVAAIQTAAMAITMGLATTLVCVFADAPVNPDKPTRAAFGRIKTGQGLEGLRYTAGLFGGASVHALAARRYMARFGAREEDFGAVAIAARQWAAHNPLAAFRTPLTMDDYLAARYIAEPFRLFDCAIPVNGAIAVALTSRARARALAQPPLHILGMGQGHPATPNQRGYERETEGGGALAAQTAFAMAGLGPGDIDICETYDAFTYLTLVTLEAYGFCGRGEAKDFVSGGAVAPGGALPVNTGGGHLSGYYLQGMTPVAEAVLQGRGQAGGRQCARADRILVTNDGGCLDYHACLILGRGEAS